MHIMILEDTGYILLQKYNDFLKKYSKVAKEASHINEVLQLSNIFATPV